jgi:hypothetical protein
MSVKPIRLIDLFRYYQKLGHQNAAIEELEQQILKAAPDIFNRDQEWYSTWSSAVEPKTPFRNAWDGVYESAKAAGAKYPECVAAQWALESGWGKHTSGENNFFGLKGEGTNAVTKEFINGQWVTITDGFIDFPNGHACIEYLVNHWYKDYKSYKGVNRASSRNECAQLLVREGYATDPKYADKLIRIMDDKAKPANQDQILNVPYEYQLDNSSGTGYRECFSSSCAMIARYYGKVKSDDDYNRIGFTKDTFVFNDPNGEADMVNGGYTSNSAARGAKVQYSRKNWLRRWEIDGPNTGWAILVKP